MHNLDKITSEVRDNRDVQLSGADWEEQSAAELLQLLGENLRFHLC